MGNTILFFYFFCNYPCMFTETDPSKYRRQNMMSEITKHPFLWSAHLFIKCRCDILIVYVALLFHIKIQKYILPLLLMFISFDMLVHNIYSFNLNIYYYHLFVLKIIRTVVQLFTSVDKSNYKVNKSFNKNKLPLR